jgi:hypothetical protein
VVGAACWADRDATRREGHLFVIVPDGGPCFTHCFDIQFDLWSQDCPRGRHLVLDRERRRAHPLLADLRSSRTDVRRRFIVRRER